MGTLESRVFAAGTRRVTAMVSGYPGVPGVRFEAVSVDGSVSVPISVPAFNNEWRLHQIEVPKEVASKPFLLRVVDESTVRTGWAGLGEIKKPESVFVTLGTWLGATAVALVCFGWLALATASLPFAGMGRFRPLFGIAALGLASFATFLAYVPSPKFGRVVGTMLLACPFVVGSLRARSRDWRRLLLSQRELLASFLLTLLITWIGLYPFTWDGINWTGPGHRWLELPVDNWLPYTFAEMLKRGVIDKPMIGDWLSSDRPPLQSGLVLMFESLGLWRDGYVYQICSTWAQTLSLVPLCLVLKRGVRSARLVAIILALVALSPTVALHGLFVWPKLFAASYCWIYFMALFDADEGVDPLRRDILAGCAAGFTLLSHGGAIPALIGTTLVHLWTFRRDALRTTLRSALVSMALLAPWVLYQRLLDPPGDRLIKWHFAGHTAITTDSFFTVFVRAYSNLTFATWFRARTANVSMMFDHLLRFPSDAVDLFAARDLEPHRDAISRIANAAFFHAGYAGWFFSPLLLVPLAWMFARRGAWPELPRGLVPTTVASLAVWAVLMFDPSSTIVHQGPLQVVIAMHVCVLIIAVQASVVLTILLGAVQLLVFCDIYVFDRPVGVAHPEWLYVCGFLLFLLGFAYACLLASKRELGDEA